MTVEEATTRLVVLARANGGQLAAADADADRALSRDPDVASVAAYGLALEVGVVTVYSPRRARWFPFDRLILRPLGTATGSFPTRGYARPGSDPRTSNTKGRE